MNNKIKKPLIHITRRKDISLTRLVIYKVFFILLSLILASLLMFILTKSNPFLFFSSLFKGCLGTERKIWILLRDFSLLLIVSLALIPSFKMKFWNLGGNGQILISALVTTMCMFYLGKKGLSDPIIILIMVPSSILAAALWAAIPAIFKAYFNTNESLFTLMMNYVASFLVPVFLTIAVPNQSGSLPEVQTGNLPEVINKHFLTIIVALIVFIFVSFYLKYTKKGYEVSVVGESLNTARYIGINEKKVIITNILISGAICGLCGLLLAGSINHSITTDSARNFGFTAIMTTYLAKFSPSITVLTTFLITFINRGMSQVSTDFNIPSDSISNIVIGLMYFFIIASDFFVSYKIIFNKKDQKEEK